MMLYLPDTNAVSAYLRGTDASLVAHLQSAFAEIRLSVIVVAEREFGFVHGVAGSRMHARFDELLALVPVEPLTREDAGFYATIRSALEKKQQGIGPLDTLIAAQALRLGATVVTRNVREFRRVPHLKVEDWQTR
ncbi:MAG TPA: type II toxin-antitoxin system VapC family toxin [Opitutaceae bacterium]|jgi:tRNA(fMet)-specific endonuclease VapC|nr:type II toxin-antitoxin system VapC family toxin [Opitutaceae bacterium]